MSSKHRMPGTQAGQLYAYPAQRWCRRKRSYLTIDTQVFTIFSSHFLMNEKIKVLNADNITSNNILEMMF